MSKCPLSKSRSKKETSLTIYKAELKRNIFTLKRNFLPYFLAVKNEAF